MTSYEEKLQQEAALWGSVDEASAAEIPPDWHYHRTLRHNAIMHTADIEAMLSRVQPGMRALELGCASGWMSLAMAQRGADVTGLDVSERSLAVAQRYYEQVRTETPGTMTYALADLNVIALRPNSFDVIVTKGTLHHLTELEYVVDEVYRALKPGGLFWISDQDGDESLATALVAGGLMFALPTTVSYADKIAGLAKFGLNAPSRIKASMEAEGLSPFEGAGRDYDWVKLVGERFNIEQKVVKPAVTGYITHQVDLPDTIANPLLRGLHAVDSWLVARNWLQSTGVILYARKPA
ncbi:MAG: class I SAM-dependent methyltransferase [Chloroflexota bacterium]